MGVQVILVGIPTSQRSNQSAALIREVDEHIVLPKEFWDDHFTPINDEEAPQTTAAPATGGGANAVGVAFAQEWIADARADQLLELAGARPRIPGDLDIQLLIKAEASLGSLRERQDLKYELREGFWATIVEASAATG